MRFLHLEDSSPDAELIAALLDREWPDCVVRRVDSREQFTTALQLGDFELILSDYTLSGFDGLSALELARVWCPEKPFIFISGTIGEERAVEALQRGATDYVIKDRTARLIPAIRQALARSDEARRHQLTEDALRQNRERFRQIAEHVADLIVLVDAAGRRLYANPAYHAIISTASDDAGGGDIFNEVHPDDQARIRAEFQRIVRTGNAQRSEFRILRPDGADRHVEAHSTAIRDHDGSVKNVLVVARDVTERRLAETRIREQAALLDQAQDAIMVQNLAGVITYWNKGAERIYGWTAGEAMGRDAGALLPVDPARQRFAREHARARGEWRGELRHHTKRQEEVTVQSRWTLVNREDRAASSFLVINTDITDNKLLEAKFLRAQRMESMGMLVGGIAHDLNNVLAPILMAVDMLQGLAPTPKARGLVDALDRSARHGAALVQQLLAFARGAEGRHVEVDLRPLLTEFVEFMGQTLKGNVRVALRFNQPPPPIQADVTQLKQVLMNLCINARDAMPEGGRITITVDLINIDEARAGTLPEGNPGAHVVLVVADTGTGIPPEVMERIFDPFYTTKAGGKGTGLGLSTVRGIVKGHGGFLTVESQPGCGTTFRIHLPVAGAPAGHPEAAAPKTAPTVLLVDDEEMIRNTLSLLLKSEGYQVCAAEDGNAALAQFREKRPEIDLVITDLKMSGMNGYELITALRGLDAKLPIIALTGMADARQAEAVGALGARMLAKPMTRAILTKAVEQALAASA
jgi:PAS domain S-box-containing protein